MVLSPFGHLEFNVHLVLLEILAAHRAADDVGVTERLVHRRDRPDRRILQRPRKGLPGTELEKRLQLRIGEHRVPGDGELVHLVRFPLGHLEVDIDVLRILRRRRDLHLIDLEVEIPEIVVFVA